MGIRYTPIEAIDGVWTIDSGENPKVGRGKGSMIEVATAEDLDELSMVNVNKKYKDPHDPKSENYDEYESAESRERRSEYWKSYKLLNDQQGAHRPISIKAAEVNHVNGVQT